MLTHPNLIYFDGFVFCSIPRSKKFVLMSAYANVFFTIICKCYVKSKFYMSGVHCGGAVRFGQVVPADLITAYYLCAFLLYLQCGGFKKS